MLLGELLCMHCVLRGQHVMHCVLHGQHDTNHSGDYLRSLRKSVADVIVGPSRRLADRRGCGQACDALREQVDDLARSHNSAQ